MNENDVVKHLKTLGLSPQDKLTADGIKSAWRKKVNEHHPDKGGDSNEFIKITHAYKMLTDPSYRDSDRKQVEPDTPDLSFRVQLPVSFEDAFFGKKVSMCYNRLEIGKNFRPIVKEEQEMMFVDLELPQGCQSGHEIIKEGMGLKCENEFGNMIVKIIPGRHPKFQLAGANVVSEESFPLDILLKGGDVEVPTMYGLKTVTIPPGTAPGSELTIKKCGVGQFGDHLLVVKQLFPSKEELKKKTSWQGLGIDWGKEPSTEASQEESLMNAFRRLKQEAMNEMTAKQRSKKPDDEESL